MSDPFDLVKELEPTVPTLSKTQIDHHRAVLIAAIADEQAHDALHERVAGYVVEPKTVSQRRSRWRRGSIALIAIAALVAAIVVLALPKGSSIQGGYAMKLVDSVSSPFQTVGADPGTDGSTTDYLQCVTDSTCYGTSNSTVPGGSPVIYRTDDGGFTWVATASLPDLLTAPLACTSATDCMAAVTGTPGPGGTIPNSLPIATTTDGGTHWTASSLVLPPSLAGSEIENAACANAEQCVVYVGVKYVPTGTTNPSQATAFFTTSNAGATWTEAAPVPVGVSNDIWTMQCAADGACIGVTEDGASGASEVAAVRSTDFGNTWTAEPSTPVALGGPQLFVSCGDTAHCMMVGYSAKTDYGEAGDLELASTADGGATWQVSAAPASWADSARSLSCPTDLDCFVATASVSRGTGFSDPIIEATTDGGTTWTTLGFPSTVNGAWVVDALSCPSADGCLGVISGGDFQQMPEPSPVLVTSLPQQAAAS